MSNRKPLEETALWKAGPMALRAVLITTCSIVVLLVGASVTMRYILKTDLFGVEELITVATMWLYFLGAIYGSYEESHIKGDMLNMLFKTNKQRKAHQLYVYVYTSFVLAVWAKWSLDYVARCFGTGQVTPGWHLPLWISQLPTAIGMCGMLFYSVYHLQRNIFKDSSQFGLEGVDKTCQSD